MNKQTELTKVKDAHDHADQDIRDQENAGKISHDQATMEREVNDGLAETVSEKIEGGETFDEALEEAAEEVLGDALEDVLGN